MIPVRESPGTTSACDGEGIMESERDRKISARAYELWEEGGRPDGHADAHWAQATREIEPAGEHASKTSSSRSAPRSAGAKAVGKAAAEPSVKSSAKAPSARSAGAPVAPAAVAKKPAARAGAKT